MHHPTDKIIHTTAFVTPVVEHWLKREIAQWVHPMKDRSDDPSHHERTLLPRSYVPLRERKGEIEDVNNTGCFVIRVCPHADPPASISVCCLKQKAAFLSLQSISRSCSLVHFTSNTKRRKCFNGAVDTFYLRLHSYKP